MGGSSEAKHIGSEMEGRPSDSILLQSEVRTLLDLVAHFDLTELEIERDGLRVRIRREPGLAALPQPGAAASPAAQGQAESEPYELIASPWVGVFHASVRQGDEVAPRQPVGTVEALRMRHEVEAQGPGVVDEVLVSDGHVVEYGQALIRLRSLASGPP